METSDLEKHYHDTNAKTLALWEKRDGIGAVRERFMLRKSSHWQQVSSRKWPRLSTCCFGNCGR